MTTRDLSNVTPEVRQAIDELAAGFPAARVSAEADGDGGAYVFVEDVPLAKIYEQCETWAGFHITYQYPSADVYPHFVRGDLQRANGDALGKSMTTGSFQGRSAIQLSRRSNHWNPARDTALLKLQKVLQWLNSRP